MISRVRDYRTLDEARNEWSKFSLPEIAASELELRGTLFVYVEGSDEAALKKISAAVEELGGRSFRCDGTEVKRLIIAARPEMFEDLPLQSRRGGGKEMIAVEAVQRFLRPALKPIVLPSGELSFDRTLVMGILNVTPDSFSDGGKYLDKNKAFDRAMQMVEEGADILDVGGESTRPYSEPVSENVELDRVIPIISEIASSTNVPISVDTTKPEVALRAVENGASIINDISGLRSSAMMRTVADLQVPIVVMHMLGEPKDMQTSPRYEDVVGDISLYLGERIIEAEQAGVDKDKIIIDPGIGFGKSLENNLDIVRRLREFKCLGRPILIGASRKGFIGKVIGTEKHERLEGSLAIAAASVAAGANIVRVHDVKETVRTTKMIDALMNGSRNDG